MLLIPIFNDFLFFFFYFSFIEEARTTCVEYEINKCVKQKKNVFANIKFLYNKMNVNVVI